MSFGDHVHGSRVTVVAICLLLFGYVALRAHTLSFTHDESLSYTIARFDSGWAYTANHHPLNTWMMKVCGALFGYGEFSLRLPNLLCFVFYLASCYYFASRAANLALALVVLSTLLLNPFLLEYFSLARGYGIALGCMLVSVVFALRGSAAEQTAQTQLGSFAAALLFGALAMAASFSVLNFFLALLGLVTVQYVIGSLKSSRRTWRQHAVALVIFGLALVPVVLVVRRLLALSESQQLYFGAATWAEAASSLISTWMLLPETEPVSADVGRMSVLCLGAVAVAVICCRRWSSPSFNVACLLVGIGVAVTVEHRFFGASFPRERTGLYMIPLVALLAYFLVAGIHRRLPARGRRVFSFALLLLITAPLLYNFIRGANLRYAHTWKYDAHTRDAIERIVSSDRYRDTGSARIRISNHWLFEPTLNYYIALRGLNIGPADRAGIHGDSDFVYAFATEAPPPGFHEVAAYNDIGTVLYEKRE
jgi:hypothetical protein